MAVTNLVNIKIKAVENLSEKLDGIKGATDNASKGFSSFKNRIESLQPTFQKMAGYGTAIFAGFSYGILNTTKDAGELESALKGLQSIVEGTGQDFDASQKFLQSYTKDGLVPMNNAATALKNLMAKGFSLKEATVLMDRFKDSASFGRQASLSLGDAVQSATEGIKNENSVLVDNAGITKNISVMQEEYAKSIGTTVANLTDAQKNEAIYQGILKESQFQVGDAQKASEGYQGQMAKLNATKLQLSQTIGQALMPVVTSLLEVMTPIIQSVTAWIGQNSELTAKILIGVTAIAGLIAIIGTLGLAIPGIIAGFGVLTTVTGALGTAMMFLATNPIGLVITAIAALGIAAWTLYKNWDEVKTNLVAVWEQLKIDMCAIADIIASYIMGVFTRISDFVTEKIDWMKNKAQQAKEFLSSIMDSYSKSSVGQSLQNFGGTVYDLTQGANAVGGRVTAGSTYRVNEQGQEFFTPSQSGYITPAGKGGSMSIDSLIGTVNVYNEADENRLIEKMKRMLTQEAKNYNLGIS